jgi:hypothetical protein
MDEPSEAWVSSRAEADEAMIAVDHRVRMSRVSADAPYDEELPERAGQSGKGDTT